jgi:CRISPR/Cas system endoribonuclease Cas6 (RAMP superfamily)
MKQIHLFFFFIFICVEQENNKMFEENIENTKKERFILSSCINTFYKKGGACVR